MTAIPPLPLPEHAVHTLDNGIQCVAVRAPGLHQAMINVVARVGSRYEPVRTNGVSHFLEHAFFRGSARYPSTFAMNVAVEDFGGSLNGSTGRESSAYFTPIHPRALGVAVEVLSDMLFAPKLTDIELEREIILEEMLDEVDDEGRDIDIDNIAKVQVFGDHGLALKIAGTPESVRNIQLADLQQHLAEHYHGGNLVVCAAGDFNPEALFEPCVKHFARAPRAKPVPPLVAPVFPRGPSARFIEHKQSQLEMRVTFLAVPEEHPDYYPLAMLARLLDDGLSSPLQRRMVEQQALAYSVAAGIDRYSDCALFELDAASAPKKAVRVFEELLATLGAFVHAPPSQEELARARTRYAISLEFALDSTSELAGWFGGNALFGELDFASRRARLEAVTAEDIQRVARSTFRKESLHLTCVGPLGRAERQKLEAALQSPPGL
jgi:predicted Zn-dependent peptidase